MRLEVEDFEGTRVNCEADRTEEAREDTVDRVEGEEDLGEGTCLCLKGGISAI